MKYSLTNLLVFSFFVSCRTFAPVAYEPPAKPESVGIYAPNTELQKSILLAIGKVKGLESLEVDADGNIYGGDKDGRIIRITLKGEIKPIAYTEGRPLGIQFDNQGNLIIADAYRGLLSLDKSGKITVLVSEYKGKPFKFTDDLDIAKDGKIYFSDASIYEQKEYLYDLLEARPYGRVFVYDPKTKETLLLADELYFANGIALSKTEDFLLVNETYRYRVTKLWLKGPKKGTKETVIENLPGFPDNITRNENGEFWVALFTVRNDRMDNMHPSPVVKRMISFLPKFLWPKPEPFGYAMKIDGNGKVLMTLQDPGGEHLKEVTSVLEKKRQLYIGSLYNDRVGIYVLP
ncbi:SMP-30/gluconolactonase/LRE family protein [Leptospira meyeri]|uniref:Sugar lactone lactonase YvrE n=1 Tax=Leptospira meyeri TaxID=29508 RepID=A0A4R8MPW8_LEPME|nr:SMP-30/gluconolactonase/LRE family protein [Leptospira meyeri]EKJ86320.1 strictosidine synthase [Leptospira meyeri serovar Hardjo str. Went 5]EMJ88737.1 strictosidine synthase [Leptospira meyeri serovar Semaranga str. Veldrot Semarang 173]TDY67359.1 sugar lactone lactonase YvrE [Leptospira meyeri]TGL50138.1 SMP-30/gluconolactonase/LRE family protein [Leptospira meyeri]